MVIISCSIKIRQKVVISDMFLQAPDYKGVPPREGPRGLKGYKGAGGVPGFC